MGELDRWLHGYAAWSLDDRRDSLRPVYTFAAWTTHNSTAITLRNLKAVLSMTRTPSQKPLWVSSRSRALPLLLLIGGVGTVVLMIIHPFHEKLAIVGNTLGLLSILVAIHLLDQQGRSLAPILSRPWLRYLPLVIGISVFLLVAPALPLVSAFALAATLTLVFALSRASNVSKTYVALLAVLLTGSIAYSAFYYYPLGLASDSLGALSVASGIVQRGHYSGFVIPIDSYYHAFPVMSVDTSILYYVTGLALPLSMLVFPGTIILLQTLLVFVVSRLVFDNAHVAVLSALLVVTEPAVTQFTGSPISQSVATSLLLILLIAMFGRVRSRGRTVVALVVFLTLVALHGAVALICVGFVSYLIVFERKISYRGLIRPLVALLLGYWMVTFTIDVMASRLTWTVEHFLEFVSTPGSALGSEVYGAGAGGLTYVWWGFPVSLALFSILVQRTKHASWAYAGLGLLGLSFAGNILAPSLSMDRYGGLTAWFILAIAGGKALSGLTRTSRQMFILIPILLLVSFSAVATPSLSPQCASQAYLDVLPTTNADRRALDWVNDRVVKSVFADRISVMYLTFGRYQTGVLSGRIGVSTLPGDAPNPTPSHPLFVRCSSSASGLVSQHRDDIVNRLYDTGCDALEASVLT